MKFSLSLLDLVTSRTFTILLCLFFFFSSSFFTSRGYGGYQQNTGQRRFTPPMQERRRRMSRRTDTKTSCRVSSCLLACQHDGAAGIEVSLVAVTGLPRTTPTKASPAASGSAVLPAAEWDWENFPLLLLITTALPFEPSVLLSSNGPSWIYNLNKSRHDCSNKASLRCLNWKINGFLHVTCVLSRRRIKEWGYCSASINLFYIPFLFSFSLFALPSSVFLFLLIPPLFGPFWPVAASRNDFYCKIKVSSSDSPLQLTTAEWSWD